MSKSSKEKTNDSIIPQPENLAELLQTVNDLCLQNSNLYKIVKDLQKLLPNQDDKPKLTEKQFESLYVTGNRYSDPYVTAFVVSPTSISLVSLDEYLSKNTSFKIVDKTTLPDAPLVVPKIEKPQITFTTVDFPNKSFSVPMANEIYLVDEKTKIKYIVNYRPLPDGSAVRVEVIGCYENTEEAQDFVKAVKLAVLQSPYIKGQVVEITEGSNFTVIDLGEQKKPIFADELMDEFDKNIVSLYEKEQAFRDLGIPLSRKIILSGPPGNGKTSISRYVASKLKGKVTTVWVSAKAIERRRHIEEIFDIARKLSPSLIVMEDIDLISGTREIMGHDNLLGEMLNQLDGISKNDSIVVIASTNKLSMLDEALSERPGRFDRIFEVGKPAAELAVKIAEEYLRERKISDQDIESLNLESIFTEKEFSGAQIVEIIKGALFECIHAGGTLNEQFLRRSKKGLQAQKELIVKNNK